jgi:hypothetical protein
VNAAAASSGFFREVIILYIFDVSCVCGSGMFIPDPDFFFHPGFPIPHPKTKKEEGETVSSQKLFTKLSEISVGNLGSGKSIPDPVPGVKKASDPISGSAKLVVTIDI